MLGSGYTLHLLCALSFVLIARFLVLHPVWMSGCRMRNMEATHIGFAQQRLGPRQESKLCWTLYQRKSKALEHSLSPCQVMKCMNVLRFFAGWAAELRPKQVEKDEVKDLGRAES